MADRSFPSDDEQISSYKETFKAMSEGRYNPKSRIILMSENGHRTPDSSSVRRTKTMKTLNKNKKTRVQHSDVFTDKRVV